MELTKFDKLMPITSQLAFLTASHIESEIENLRHRQKFDPYFTSSDLQKLTIFEEEQRQRTLKELQESLSSQTSFLTMALPKATTPKVVRKVPLLNETFFIQQRALCDLIEDSIAHNELRIINHKGEDVTDERGENLSNLDSTVAFVGSKAKEVEKKAVILAAQLKEAGVPVVFYDNKEQEPAWDNDASDHKVAICIPVPESAPRGFNLFNLNLEEIIDMINSQEKKKVVCHAFSENEIGIVDFMQAALAQSQIDLKESLLEGKGFRPRSVSNLNARYEGLAF